MANKTNQINIPEARQAMYNMKHEVANELGITLNQGYNGNLSSKDAGHIGGKHGQEDDRGAGAPDERSAAPLLSAESLTGSGSGGTPARPPERIAETRQNRPAHAGRPGCQKRSQSATFFGILSGVRRRC